MNVLFKLLYIVVLILLGGNITAQITPQEAVSIMKKGINLGNTLEPPDEGGWNNGPAREVYFDMYKQAGFQAVRVPVRWDEHTGDNPPYRINADWMDRVEEVLDWGLSRDLFVIVNAHHEEWIKSGYSDPANRARFDSIWSQIAVRFKDKSEKLLFEIINEPKGLTQGQNDELHQRILSIIRKSNPTRNVIIQGHNWGGAEELITMTLPEDDFLIGSFHSYDPWPFGLEGHGPFGPLEIKALISKFDALRSWSDSTGIPVFLGEFACHNDADYNLRMLHYRTYTELSSEYGFTPCVWDDGGNFKVLERSLSRWNEIKDILIHTTEEAPVNLNISVMQDTMALLEWGNRLPDYDSIVIQRKTHFGSFITYASLPPDSSRFIDDQVIPKLYYYYRIIAYRQEIGLYSQPVRLLMPEYIPEERGFFLGYPLPVPGTIEAEDFDLGGEGKAYHDLDDINLASAYRPEEGVDIYDRLGEGYHVGNAFPGEWLEYTLDVASEGEYLMEVYLAAIQSGGQFSICIGNSYCDTLLSLASGSWLNTTPVSARLHLAQGQQVLRFTIIDEPQFNFDKIVFSPDDTGVEEDRLPGSKLYLFQESGGDLLIKTSGASLLTRVQVFDLRGKLIAVSKDHSDVHRIPGHQLHPGIYLVQAYEDERLYTEKILIQ